MAKIWPQALPGPWPWPLPRPLPGPSAALCRVLRHLVHDPSRTLDRPKSTKMTKMTKIWSKSDKSSVKNVKMAQNDQNPEKFWPRTSDRPLHRDNSSQPKLWWKISARFQKFQNLKVKMSKMAKKSQFLSSDPLATQSKKTELEAEASEVIQDLSRSQLKISKITKNCQKSVKIFSKFDKILSKCQNLVISSILVPVAIETSWDLSGSLSHEVRLFGKISLWAPWVVWVGTGQDPKMSQNGPKWPNRPDPQILTSDLKFWPLNLGTKFEPSPTSTPDLPDPSCPLGTFWTPGDQNPKIAKIDPKWSNPPNFWPKPLFEILTPRVQDQIRPDPSRPRSDFPPPA